MQTCTQVRLCRRRLASAALTLSKAAASCVPACPPRALHPLLAGHSAHCPALQPRPACHFGWLLTALCGLLLSSSPHLASHPPARAPRSQQVVHPTHSRPLPGAALVAAAGHQPGVCGAALPGRGARSARQLGHGPGCDWGHRGRHDERACCACCAPAVPQLSNQLQLCSHAELVLSSCCAPAMLPQPRSPADARRPPLLPHCCSTSCQSSSTSPSILAGGWPAQMGGVPCQGPWPCPCPYCTHLTQGGWTLALGPHGSVCPCAS